MIIQGKQRFTTEGKIGVALFLLSPFASAFFGIVFYKTVTNFRSDDELGPALMLLASALAFMVGIVLMLVGRSYEFAAIQQNQANETKGLWSK